MTFASFAIMKKNLGRESEFNEIRHRDCPGK